MGSGKQHWKCKLDNCSRINKVLQNLTKHQARAHRETWKPIARIQVHCPYGNRKYSTAILLLQHLGMRRDKYTWQTSTFPLKPTTSAAHMIWNAIWEYNNNYRTENPNEQIHEQQNQKRKMENQTTPIKS